eukprot:Mrub_06547.p1 GENE.Mrub_06547~~Mrub_06547.p1  ORF type:complete len:325 (+),score=77.86 Mrub_06547:136-975(+)
MNEDYYSNDHKFINQQNDPSCLKKYNNVLKKSKSRDSLERSKNSNPKKLNINQSNIKQYKTSNNLRKSSSKNNSKYSSKNSNSNDNSNFNNVDLNHIENFRSIHNEYPMDRNKDGKILTFTNEDDKILTHSRPSTNKTDYGPSSIIDENSSNLIHCDSRNYQYDSGNESRNNTYNNKSIDIKYNDKNDSELGYIEDKLGEKFKNLLDPKNIVENESDEQKSSSRNNTNRNSRVRESNSCQSINAGGDGLNQSGIFNDFVSANEYVQKVEINDELIEEEF